MNVGVLGSGDVGKALASGFLGLGDTVTVGTRSPGRLEDWAGQNPGVHLGTFAEAVGSADLVALAVKGSAAVEALRAAGTENLAGKCVMDATNPITDEPPVNGVLRFFTKLDASLMELLQRTFPQVHFVKAFNSVGHAHMVSPRFEGGPPTMFICGNDSKAKETVAGVVRRFGWEPLDMGGAQAARAIEPLCMLWCIPGFLRNEWDHAFKYLA